MGKGDKRTFKGKLFKGSFGNSRTKRVKSNFYKSLSPPTPPPPTPKPEPIITTPVPPKTSSSPSPQSNLIPMKYFLISCCRAKIQPDFNEHNPLNPSEEFMMLRQTHNYDNQDEVVNALSFNNFYNDRNNNLCGFRNLIIEAYKNIGTNNFPRINRKRQNGQHVNLDFRRVAPAINVYDGNLYRQVNNKNWKNCNCENWIDCNCSNKMFEILILSPLFGWIKHTDKIPNYNLEMNDRIDLGSKFNNWEGFISKFWTHILEPAQNLANIFFNPETTFDLLGYSINCLYRPACGANLNDNCYQPLTNYNLDNEIKNLNLGIGVNAFKGRRLNLMLNQLREHNGVTTMENLQNFNFGEVII